MAVPLFLICGFGRAFVLSRQKIINWPLLGAWGAFYFYLDVRGCEMTEWHVRARSARPLFRRHRARRPNPPDFLP